MMLNGERLERETTEILDRKLARTASAIDELEVSLLRCRDDERKATRIYHDLKKFVIFLGMFVAAIFLLASYGRDPKAGLGGWRKVVVCSFGQVINALVPVLVCYFDGRPFEQKIASALGALPPILERTGDFLSNLPDNFTVVPLEVQYEKDSKTLKAVGEALKALFTTAILYMADVDQDGYWHLPIKRNPKLAIKHSILVRFLIWMRLHNGETQTLPETKREREQRTKIREQATQLRTQEYGCVRCGRPPQTLRRSTRP